MRSRVCSKLLDFITRIQIGERLGDVVLGFGVAARLELARLIPERAAPARTVDQQPAGRLARQGTGTTLASNSTLKERAFVE
jgi:hypothetical protein